MTQENLSEVRTRIAPSPTGYPHIGTIYQALFNYAYAKKHKGKFLVRIEDTDRTRFVEGTEDAIFSYLDWVGLVEDESPRKGGAYGPYRQSERLEVYHKYAEELLEKGGAYFAYYPKKEAGQKDYTGGNVLTVSKTDENSPATIAEMVMRGDWIVRLKVPQDAPISIKDEIRGEITFDSKQVTEQVLIKSDGFPTYHFAVVVDDHLMKISHIVRAEEWLPSTPKHVLLYNYFGWTIPLIYHTATLRNPDKSKLSKRHGHTNVGWYQEQGFLPEAILNYLGLLGWSHPEEKEIFNLSEFIEKFDLKDVRPIAPIFDLKKLEWMNGEYIRKTQISKLKSQIYSFYNGELSEEVIEKFLPVAQTRMKKLIEFKDLVSPFLEKQSLELTAEQKEVKKALAEHLNTQESWDVQAVTDTLLSFAKEHGLNFKKYYRMIIGCDQGLPLGDTFAILGKEKTLELLS